MKVGTKISLKSSGSLGVVIAGNHANDSVPASLVYVQLKESGKKFYYQANDLKTLKKKAAPKKAAPVKEEVAKEPVAKKTATPKKEKKS